MEKKRFSLKRVGGGDKARREREEVSGRKERGGVFRDLVEKDKMLKCRIVMFSTMKMEPL